MPIRWRPAPPGAAPDEIAGKPVLSALGPHRARRIKSLAALARERKTQVDDVDDQRGTTSPDGHEWRQVDLTHTIPAATTASDVADLYDAVLVVEEDITKTVVERERRETIKSQTIAALVDVVDRRDRYSANHSRHVSRLAGALAREMDLDAKLVEAVETAGLLMNLGKILVPIEILTKPGALSPEEHAQIRESLQTSSDMVRGIPFDGPVAETIEQVREKVDGSGEPRGLDASTILPTAQVLAIANAFVALVSPRAHRDAATPETALSLLEKDADRAFAKPFVIALTHLVVNKGEWQTIAAADAPLASNDTVLDHPPPDGSA